MQIKIELSESDVKQLVLNELERRLGDVPLDKSRVVIEVKSAQNYRSEWETAHYRCSYSHVA